MASLIACPHCGPRPKEEFTVRGDAGMTRPAPDAGEDAWHSTMSICATIRAAGIGNIGTTPPAAGAGWSSSAIR